MISILYSLRGTKMAKNVYHDGKLIPAKDWDYELKRPKAKEPKRQPVIEVVEEVTEQIID